MNFLEYKGSWGGRLVVHGHTPKPAVEFKSNRVCVDSSAAYGQSLSACNVLTGDTWSVKVDPLHICKYRRLGCNHAEACVKTSRDVVLQCGYHKYFQFLEEDY